MSSSTASSRLLSTLQDGDVPLVGRERELEDLLKLWDRAVSGSGGIAWITGHGGVGKSRLVRALRASVTKGGCSAVQCQGSAYHRHTAFHAAAELLAHGLGIDPAASDAAEALWSKIGEGPFASGLPLFASVLSIPTDVPATPAPSEVVRERTLELLAQWLIERGTTAPTLLIAEDLHFMDPSTLELLARVGERAQRARVLLVATSRDTVTVPFSPAAFVTRIALGPLSRAETRTLVEHHVGGKSLPDELIAMLIDRTDGLPLFIEELTKMLLDSGLLAETAHGYELTAALPGIAIPSTLQGSLTARLDRLADGKRIVQTAAVLGREFSTKLLASVVGSDPLALRPLLDRLVAAEIIEHDSVYDEDRYTFKQTLLQEAAYQSLLRSTRQELHRGAAQTLRSEFPGLRDHAPELLAHHYDAGRQVGQAITYWQRAGQRAIATSAVAEAVEHLTRALALIRELPGDSNRDQKELLATAALVVALFTTRGYAASDVEQAIERALELCARVGWSPITSFLHQLRASSHTTRGDYDAACDVARRLIRDADLHGDAASVLRARGVLGQSLLFQGNLDAAEGELERASTLRELEEARAAVMVQGVDTSLLCTGWLAWVHHFKGDFARATERASQAVRTAEALDHPYSIAFSALLSGTLHQLRVEPHQARRHAERALELAKQYRFALCEGWAILLGGWISLDEGDAERAESELRRGLEIWERVQASVGSSLFGALRGVALARCGKNARGLECIERARDRAEQHGELIYRAELDRLMGRAVIESRTPDALERAEALFRTALGRAEVQGSRWCELRAALSLAQLLADKGDRGEAREQLARARKSLGDARHLPELAEADRVLATLA